MNLFNPYTYLNELNSIVQQIPLAYAFAAGMVAAINPCGFLMLPSFTAFYLSGRSLNHEKVSAWERGVRSLFLGLLMTLGFIAVFGPVGLAVSLGGRALLQVFPWSGLVIGAGLVLLGLWLLVTRRSVGLLAATHISPGYGRNPAALLAFGVAYGIASLGCTLPMFLVVVGSALSTRGVVASLVQFLNFSLGMGVFLTIVALSIAYFHGALLGPLRRLLPHIETLGSVFLVLAGIYLLYYWFTYGRLLI